MLADRLGGLPVLSDVRGHGFFFGLEFVADRESKELLPTEFGLHLHIRARSPENGIICYPMGGNVDGVKGDIVILAPPYNATDDELTEIVGKLESSVRQGPGSVRILSYTWAASIVATRYPRQVFFRNTAYLMPLAGLDL